MSKIMALIVVVFCGAAVAESGGVEPGGADLAKRNAVLYKALTAYSWQYVGQMLYEKNNRGVFKKDSFWGLAEDAPEGVDAVGHIKINGLSHFYNAPKQIWGFLQKDHYILPRVLEFGGNEMDDNGQGEVQINNGGKTLDYEVDWSGTRPNLTIYNFVNLPEASLLFGDVYISGKYLVLVAEYDTVMSKYIYLAVEE